jgi:hypothetical protein
MMLFVIQLAPFITRTVLVVALIVACLNSGMAQAQELTAHEPSREGRLHSVDRSPESDRV